MLRARWHVALQVHCAAILDRVLVHTIDAPIAVREESTTRR
jgi:hypothetical protein